MIDSNDLIQKILIVINDLQIHAVSPILRINMKRIRKMLYIYYRIKIETKLDLVDLSQLILQIAKKEKWEYISSNRRGRQYLIPNRPFSYRDLLAKYFSILEITDPNIIENILSQITTKYVKKSVLAGMIYYALLNTQMQRSQERISAVLHISPVSLRAHAKLLAI